jgi:hypothetical protein
MKRQRPYEVIRDHEAEAQAALAEWNRKHPRTTLHHALDVVFLSHPKWAVYLIKIFDYILGGRFAEMTSPLSSLGSMRALCP